MYNTHLKGLYLVKTGLYSTHITRSLQGHMFLRPIIPIPSNLRWHGTLCNIQIDEKDTHYLITITVLQIPKFVTFPPKLHSFKEIKRKSGARFESATHKLVPNA